MCLGEPVARVLERRHEAVGGHADDEHVELGRAPRRPRPARTAGIASSRSSCSRWPPPRKRSIAQPAATYHGASTPARRRAASSGRQASHFVDVGLEALSGYSHSIVPGGFDVRSSATRFTAGISLMIRLEIVSSRS